MNGKPEGLRSLKGYIPSFGHVKRKFIWVGTTIFTQSTFVAWGEIREQRIELGVGANMEGEF